MAEQLNLFYAPTLIAFDESGHEIIRIDSVAHVYRLKSVLEFIVSKTYVTTPDFMTWRFDEIFGGGKMLPPVEMRSDSLEMDEEPQGSSN